MTERVQKAREFAVKAHGDQKYGDQPYSVHLDDVAGVLQEFGYDDDFTLMVAYLHDVLEDTPTTRIGIVAAFDPQDFPLSSIPYAVEFVTDEPGATRRERKRATYSRVIRRIASLDTRGFRFGDDLLAAIRVKLADRIANIRRSVGSDLFRMYRKEREVFYLAYYSDGVADEMWVEYDKLLG